MIGRKNWWWIVYIDELTSFWMFRGMSRLFGGVYIFYLMSWISFYMFNYVLNDENFIVSLNNNSEWKLDRVKVKKIDLKI